MPTPKPILRALFESEVGGVELPCALRVGNDDSEAAENDCWDDEVVAVDEVMDEDEVVAMDEVVAAKVLALLVDEEAVAALVATFIAIVDTGDVVGEVVVAITIG